MESISAKVRSLTVRPIRSADLAFSIPGILSSQSEKAWLGQRVAAFVRDSFEAQSGSTAPTAGELRDRLLGHALFVQGNARIAAEHDQALASYRAGYLEKYSDIEALSALLREENNGRLVSVNTLISQVGERHTELADEYKNAKSTGVLRMLTSTSRHESDASPVVRTFSAPMQLATPGYDIVIKGGGMSADMKHTIPEVVVNPKTYKAGTFQGVSEELTIKSQGGQTQITGVLTQVTETDQRPVVTDSGLPQFVHPSKDEEIESTAALAELESEKYDRLVRGFRLKKLEEILDCENNAARLEVEKRRATLLETYLFAPFDGIVTAVYKDVGEFVQVGEPVLRVESDESLLLVGYVQCRQIVTLGMRANLVAKNIFESGQTLEMTGLVVSVRGHDTDDDEWDLVIEVKNADGLLLKDSNHSARSVRLPLNLQFDRFETTLTFQFCDDTSKSRKSAA